ncbi:MAG: ABC transporter ATP-binding protein [Chloroflexi bacterium]|nr:ABC transporter ATP-binding protein [Chloroflexota bacterium]MCY3938061.1 ABC transporter ATP-binding protein [Chloroflexota bacterium]
MRINNGSEPVVRLEGLTKRFGSLTAVDQLDLEVIPGEVFGFLGPNGAGKSTTIGMMLGLIEPTAGSVEMFGMDASRHRSDVLRRVGAIIEAPAFYPYLSGRDNLRVVARYSGGGHESQIDEVLELVGLGGREKDKIKHYSTGMKQRLGLASVLLGEPDLIVLDEPTAGLDPAGTHEFRELIRATATESGRTVFMSSHLLSEVQQTCDRVAIINRGRTVLQESLEDLLHRVGGVYFEVDDSERAETALTAAGVAASVGNEPNTVWAEVGRERIGELNSLLVGAGLVVSGSGVRSSDLESVFLEVTGNGASKEESGN